MSKTDKNIVAAKTPSEVKPMAVNVGFIGDSRRASFLKKAAFVAAAVALLGIGVAITLHSLNNRNQTEVRATKVSKVVCSDDIIKTASAAVFANDPNGLHTIQSDILHKKNYNYDQNCLYILARTSLALKNTTDARNYISELKHVYNSQQTYSTTFSETMAPDQLSQLAGQVEDYNKQVANQSYGDNLHALDLNYEKLGSGSH